MYKGNFKNKEDVVEAFTSGPDGVFDEPDMTGVKILLAWYGYGDYDGSAFVLFERDNQLYEVNASHCSCYELEGQWSPEETSVEALRHRIEKGYLGKDTYTSGGVFDVALKKILTRWENKH